MITMGSYRNNIKNRQLNNELAHLINGFIDLNTKNRKEILKTAQSLLKVQKTNKKLLAEDRYSNG